MRTIDRIKADSRVEQVWNEGVDGWWVMLKTGFICKDSEAHACHEWNLRDLWTAFESVVPCDCRDCKPSSTLSH